MDAKNDALSVKDILKIYARKFLRLAPAYYGMWVLLWAATARIGDGAIWHNTNITFESCNVQWLPTLFMAGNIVPWEMNPYAGCY
jgi:rhamnogalacturonyl hydrolase YesR